MSKPLVLDLYCGLGGWAQGFLAEGWWCVGFDIERHDYGTGGYPGDLILQDVLTLHGSQFREASCIVASPPCQAYSYRAMPWSRAKALPPPDNTLFEACFRIQREASEAAGRYIPLIVENVRGAQKWVGRAKAWFGSYYLWGDVGMVGKRVVAGIPQYGAGVIAIRSSAQKVNPDGTGYGPGSWFKIADSKNRGVQAVGRKVGHDWLGGYGGGFGWDCSPMRRNNSRSSARRAASAQIAKIPFSLAQHIALTFKPYQDSR